MLSASHASNLELIVARIHISARRDGSYARGKSSNSTSDTNLMPSIFVDKPYRYVSAYTGERLPKFIRRFELFRHYLRRGEGVVDCEIRNVQRLKDSIAAGHGVMIAPNHCRTADPIVMGWLAKQADCLFYAMASWHLFNHTRFFRLAIRAMGGFSMNREGVDRTSLQMAIDTLDAARRVLLVFPEGGSTHTNDHLRALLDGVAFVARSAAKRRMKHVHGKVVIHPVGMKYFFQGNLFAAVDPILTKLEQRLGWRPQTDIALVDRIRKLGNTLLSLKEIEYLGAVQPGRLFERKERLIQRLLNPLEKEWLGGPQQGDVVPRIKALRMKILPDLVNRRVSDVERERRWQQLQDSHLAFQLSCYPPNYLSERPSVDRIFETVERLEEDFAGKATVHRNLKVVLHIGEAIEVSPQRPPRDAPCDPLMREIETRLRELLAELSLESPLYEDPRGNSPADVSPAMDSLCEDLDVDAAAS